MTGVYCFADRNIEIVSIYEKVHRYCEAYRVDAVPDFTVVTTEEDIVMEKGRSAEQNQREGLPVREYPPEYLEELAVYRKIADRMIAYDTLLFHGSAISVDGEAYIFTAKSGTGKSTHARLWREYFKDRAIMVKDDKPLIRVTNRESIVYGTPYNGKHRLGNNISVPIRAICILDRDSENHIEPISKEEAFTVLLQQTHIPNDRSSVIRCMMLLKQLINSVKLYHLGCNMELEAASVSYFGMQN